MRTKTVLDNEQRKDIVNRYENFNSIAKISRYYHVGSKVVRDILLEEGVNIRKKGRVSKVAMETSTSVPPVEETNVVVEDSNTFTSEEEPSTGLGEPVRITSW